MGQGGRGGEPEAGWLIMPAVIRRRDICDEGQVKPRSPRGDVDLALKLGACVGRAWLMATRLGLEPCWGKLDARHLLQRLARRRTAPHAEVVRAKLLLLAYEHPEWSNAAIARAVGCTDWTVRKWRRRSRAGPTLQDAPRSGGPRFFPLSGPGTGHRVGLHLAAGFR